MMKDLKKLYFNKFIFLITLLLTFSFWGCDMTSPFNEDNSDDSSSSASAADAADNESSISDAMLNNDGDHEESSDYTWSSSSVAAITLNGSSISESSSGAEASGSTLTISSAGNYSISGTLSNGQIIVNAGDDDLVRLILNGVDITCQNSAPIYIKNADKVIVIVNDGTENTLTDGSSYNYDEDEEPNATLFSKTDLTVYGEGKLTMDANFNDAINCKDGLIVDINKLVISAVDDGIRGKDYLIIKDGTINIVAGGDGLKSDNDDDETRGYIEILTAKLDITASGDAMSASTDVLIDDGTFDLVTTGSTSSYSSTSTKGIKSGVNTIINAGTFDITCNEDAIHSDQTITIYGGTYTISASDDGIHADYDLAIYDADVTITKSYEGIESTSGNMYIEGGTYVINSSDDGLNVAAGGDSMGGGGWGGKSATSTSYTMYLNPDNLAIYAQGDGIDSNGSVEVSGGNIIVHGPTSSGNGALDYDNTFKENGGLLIAAGSSGMAQAPSSSSSQNSVSLVFRSSQSAGTIYHVESSSGDELFTFKSSKTFQTLVFSSPNLKKSTSYVLYTGGTVSGDSFCGYYSNPTYSGGTQKTTFTISSTVSSVTIN